MDKIRAVTARGPQWANRSRPSVLTLYVSTLSLLSRSPADDREQERGQGLAEYSLILGGIAVVAIVSMAFLGGTITELFWDPISDEFGHILYDILGIGPDPDAIIPT
jgi:Flp pilus assembly pilin Flp